MPRSDQIVFCPLVSGSSGNSTYIACGNTRLLVDCGRSGQHIERCLSEIGIDIKTISQILITHSHIDHVQSAGTISRRYDIPIYATIGTWKEITKKNKVGEIPIKNMRVFRSSEVLLPLEFDDLRCHFFPIPHDACDPVGYRITNGTSTVAVATDLGHITPILEDNLTGVSVVLLESNYDPQMLKTGPYTPELKKRILGDFGHLSNENAGILSEKLIRTGTQRIMLGHLSKENNRPEIAWKTVSTFLKEHGIDPRREAEIFMTNRDIPSRLTTVFGCGCQ